MEPTRGRGANLQHARDHIAPQSNVIEFAAIFTIGKCFITKNRSTSTRNGLQRSLCWHANGPNHTCVSAQRQNDQKERLQSVQLHLSKNRPRECERQTSRVKARDRNPRGERAQLRINQPHNRDQKRFCKYSFVLLILDRCHEYMWMNSQFDPVRNSKLSHGRKQEAV